MTGPIPFPLSASAARALVGVEPRTRDQLRAWIDIVLGVRAPDRAANPAHDAPMDYLAHAFFESSTPRDAVVWASRGGGKTFYAAIATLLDLWFKPGIEVMILGGSLHQSQRMLAHLRTFFRTTVLATTLGAPITDRRVVLRNGSVGEVLAQSHTSVRGARPQKLRCDEADLFHPDVWAAAQLVTRSKRCGERLVRGAVEAISTWHQPAGVMGTLISEARLAPRGGAPRRVFRWNIGDVLERCPPSRSCDSCPVVEECGSRAKSPEFPGGHITIEDAIALKRRADADTWRAEMVCDRPIRTGAVYPGFDPDLHVCPCAAAESSTILGGIDFGFRDPTVILWAALAPDATVRILGERITRETTIDAIVEIIRAAPWPTPAWFGVDPAGAQRTVAAAVSPILALRRAGFAIRSRRVPVLEGLRAVRARLTPASGAPTLLIDPSCATLIGSVAAYRFPDGSGSDLPIKDGPDHACDALRYLITNLDDARGAPARAFSYV